MNEEFNNQLMREAEIITQALDKEIMNLPQKQVWYCKSQEEIESLVNRMQDCIENYYSLMSGTCDETRQMLLKMIEICEQELEDAKSVLSSLQNWK